MGEKVNALSELNALYPENHEHNALSELNALYPEHHEHNAEFLNV